MMSEFTSLFLTSRTRAIMLATVSAVAIFAADASAATVTAGTPANSAIDWLHNWNNATVSDGTFLLPAASVPDTAIINQGRTISVTAPVTVDPGNVIIGNTNSGQALTTLIVDAGGSLTTGVVTVSAGSDPGALTVQGGTLTSSSVAVRTNGTFDVTSGVVNLSPAAGSALDLDGGVMNVSGGTVTLTDPAPGGGTFVAIGGTSPGTLNLTGGVFDIAGATAANDTVAFGANDVFNISGGTFSACGGQVIAANSTAGGPEFNITGSTSTVQLDRLNLANTNRAADFNFVMDAAGVTPVTQCSPVFSNVDFANITVDGAAYTGPTTPGTFIPLFVYSNVTGGPPTLNSVTGLGTQGTDWQFIHDTTTNMVGIEFLQVPEPSSLAMLLPCLALLALRRRK